MLLQQCFFTGAWHTGRAKRKFPIIDLGAAVSVVSYDILSPSARTGVNEAVTTTIGTNGIPLDVLGSVNLLVVVGTSSARHPFVVARTLTVECLLGIDFLSRYSAIIDCADSKVTFSCGQTQGTAHEDSNEEHHGSIAFAVSVAQNTRIPPRSQLVVKGKLVRELWRDGRG